MYLKSLFILQMITFFLNYVNHVNITIVFILKINTMYE